MKNRIISALDAHAGSVTTNLSKVNLFEAMKIQLHTKLVFQIS